MTKSSGSTSGIPPTFVDTTCNLNEVKFTPTLPSSNSSGEELPTTGSFGNGHAEGLGETGVEQYVALGERLPHICMGDEAEDGDLVVQIVLLPHLFHLHSLGTIAVDEEAH